MRGIDGFLWFLLIIGVLVAVFFQKYRLVLSTMLGVLTSLFLVIFFIVLAFAFFAGPKVFSFPGLKTVITSFVVIILVGGIGSTLGIEIGNQITGGAVNPAGTIFTKEFLNVAVILVIGLILFFMLLIKKNG